jgi:ATP-dependent DNA helicase RecG
MTVEILKGKPVLAIVVTRAAKPVALDGHYWRRVGNTSRKVPAEELIRFLLDKTGGHWDEIPCGFGLGSLDPAALRQFKANARKRLPAIRETDDDRIVLGNLGLIDAEGRLVRAAVLLFGKGDEPQRLSSTAFVQVGRFRGSGASIVNDQTVTGNLFAQLDGVIKTLRGMLQVRYEVPNDSDGEEGIEALRRREVWEYPLSALREAVANALLHRAYTHGGRVMVRVYDDRLIVSSPGQLPEGVTLDDLRRDPHASVLRNPRLADGFFLEGIVERWGTGTIRMAEACDAEGLPAPEFELRSGELWVTFRKDPYTDELLKSMGLSDRQVNGVRHAQAKGSVSNSEYQSVAGVSKRTATRDLADLVAKGQLRQQGETGKGTLYLLARQRSQTGHEGAIEEPSNHAR